MKKILCLLLLISLSLNAQKKLSYGVLLGAIFYGPDNNNGKNTFDTSNNSITSVNFGGYAEYNFNERIGIKTEVTLNKRDLVYFNTKDLFKMNFVEIAPNLKYDFGHQYRKGFYMLLGPKVALMTKATLDGEDVKDAFKSTTVGAQLGFGYRIIKFIDLETKFDYGLTPFYKLPNGNKSSFFGGYLSLNLDLEKLINK